MRALVTTVVTLVIGIVVGYALHTSHANTPRVCHFDGGGTLVSGDAARTTDGREWVCTDGTLIHVTSYGN